MGSGRWNLLPETLADGLGQVDSGRWNLLPETLADGLEQTGSGRRNLLPETLADGIYSLRLCQTDSGRWTQARKVDVDA